MGVAFDLQPISTRANLLGEVTSASVFAIIGNILFSSFFWEDANDPDVGSDTETVEFQCLKGDLIFSAYPPVDLRRVIIRLEMACLLDWQPARDNKTKRKPTIERLEIDFIDNG